MVNKRCILSGRRKIEHDVQLHVVVDDKNVSSDCPKIKESDLSQKKIERSEE